MPNKPVLTGYEFSVYSRSLRIALAEKGVDYAYRERNPFDPADLTVLKKSHPFGRVPVLHHGDFGLWETAAMLDYVNAGFDGPSLVPEGAQPMARMRQVIAVMDNYAYWPLVRQAFSQAILRPLMGEEGDEAEIDQGLAVAPLILDTLEKFASEGLVLARGRVCLASCHALPMLEYFALVPEGRDLLRHYKALSRWLEWMGQRPSAVATRPS
ncbi:glutathione S-transferase family protein, partial [hydrothermal vent metagenome]